MGRDEINDEMLTAYLDGELSQSDHALVEQGLRERRDLAARLSALSLPMERLRQGADQILSEAPTPPVSGGVSHMAKWVFPVGLAAALVLGLGIGTWATRPAANDWVDAVANYQSLYVSETLAVAETQAQSVEKLATLSQEIGLDLAGLSSVGAIDYRRAQLLGFQGRPLVQVAYLDGDAPIAICITAINGDDTGIEEGVRHGLAAASWQRNGYGFLVIGGSDADLIRELAEAVRREI